MFIVNFFLGLLIVVMGAFGFKYNAKITHLFPKSQFLEQRVGMGATFGLFYFVAALVVVYGFALMFSLHDNLINAIFGPILRAL